MYILCTIVGMYVGICRYAHNSNTGSVIVIVAVIVAVVVAYYYT